MTLPERVRLTGDLFHPVVPDGAVRVDRGTRYGNRHKVLPHGPHTVEESLHLFREELFGREPATVCGCRSKPRPTLDEVRAELAGKDLACWCAPGAPCHGQVLIEIANAANIATPVGPAREEPALSGSKLRGSVRVSSPLAPTVPPSGEEVANQVEVNYRVWGIDWKTSGPDTVWDDLAENYGLGAGTGHDDGSITLTFDFAGADDPHPATIAEAHQLVETRLTELGVRFERTEAI